MKKVDTLQKPSLRYKEKKFEYKRSLTEYMAFGTILFLTGSFLNNFIIMFAFNINVSHYYEAKDYITSSSTSLLFLVISSLLGIAFASYYTKNNLLSKNNKQKNYFYLKVFILFAFMIFILKINKSSNLHIFSILLLPILSITSGIIANKIHNREISLLVFITLFFHAMIISISLIDIDKIRTNTINKNCHFLLDKNKDININSKQHIKTISKYSFFYDQKNKKTIVIPNTDIVRIEQITNELLE